MHIYPLRRKREMRSTLKVEETSTSPGNEASQLPGALGFHGEEHYPIKGDIIMYDIIFVNDLRLQETTRLE